MSHICLRLHVVPVTLAAMVVTGGCFAAPPQVTGSEADHGASGTTSGTDSGAGDPATSSGDPDGGESDASGDGRLPPQTSSGGEEVDETGASTSQETPPWSEGSTGVGENPCAYVRVAMPPGEALNVRTGPSTEGQPVGLLAAGAVAMVLDEVQGLAFEGTDVWYQVATPVLEGYVTGFFSECADEGPLPADPDRFFLPLGCGVTSAVAQGNNSADSHTGFDAYAYDFAVAANTPARAMADGVVVHAYGETGPDHPCYDGGGPNCAAAGNVVVLRHADGTLTSYLHLNQVDVALGDAVPRGAVVGLSGATGFAASEHLHVMRMDDCGSHYCQSEELRFGDVAGDGRPEQGDWVTSANCPNP